MSDLEDLKRLAQEATPGGWFVGRVFMKCTRDHGAPFGGGHGGPDCVYEEFARDATYEENGTEICSDAGDEVVGSGVEGAHVSEPNARYIAAANPAAVLALIERVERAERELSSVESVLNARGSTRAFHLMTVVERVDALAEKAERVSRLDALARKGLEAYHHGEACPFAFSTRPGNPAECENEACREWAKALEEGK